MILTKLSVQDSPAATTTLPLIFLIVGPPPISLAQAISAPRLRLVGKALSCCRQQNCEYEKQTTRHQRFFCLKRLARLLLAFRR
jgi:hypothetical protein